MVHNGEPTREWLNEEESASPTVATDSLFHTMILDAREKRDVMTVDAPNAFMQTKIDQKEGQDKIIVKIAGMLVGMLVEDSLDTHSTCVVHENDKKTLCVEALRAICGVFTSALLFHMKFKEDSEEIGFKFNCHDACVAN